MDVLNNLAEVSAGRSLFGHMHRLQRFVIEKFPNEFKFKHEDLNIQSEDMLQLISERCEEAAMGCYLTLISNPTRSDINAEVHKSALTNNQDTFALDRTTAVDQLVEYEEIKRRGSTHKAAANNSGGNRNTGHSADDDSDDDNSDFSDSYRYCSSNDNEYSESDHSNNAAGDNNDDVEYTDDEESCGTVEYTDCRRCR